MQRIKSTKLLAALLLVGVCVLGVTLIVHAIGIQVSFDSSGFTNDNPHHEWEEVNEETQTASCYIYGSFMVEDGDDEDDEPDSIGGIHAQGAGWINADGTVTLFSYAYSSLYDSDRAGRANAWIKFPHEPLIPHPAGPGEVDVGAGADKSGVQIYDTRTFQQGDQLGQLQGGAALKVKPNLGRISVSFAAKVKP